MELIVDANILFSALIRDSHIRHFLILSDNSFYVPEFGLKEINRHIEIIQEKTGLNELEIKDILDKIIVLAEINIIPLDEFRNFIDTVKNISPDPDDVAYFALALKLKCPIWSNDKELKKQNVVKIYSTEELFKI